MPLASIGTAIWGFLKKIPDWVIWLVVAIVFLKFVDMRAERRGRIKAEDKAAKEAAEVESEVVSNITENSNALVRESDAVRSHDSVERLPDGTQGLPDYHFRD